jgi:hypothetical protein
MSDMRYRLNYCVNLYKIMYMNTVNFVGDIMVY